MKIIYKYGTGQEIPEGGTYLCTIENGFMTPDNPASDGGRKFIWHYYQFDIPETK